MCERLCSEFNITYRMLAQLRLCRITAIVFVALIVVCRQDAMADSDATLARIRSEWLDRQARTRSVCYQLSGTDLLPRGKMLPKGSPELEQDAPAQPEHDHSSRFESTFQWNIPKQQFSKEWRGEIFNIDDLQFFKKHLRYVCNDGVFSSLREHDHGSLNGAIDSFAPPHVIVYKEKHPSGFISTNDYALTLAHGMFITEDWNVLDKPELISAKDLTLTYVGSALTDGRDCVIIDLLRTSPRHRLLRDRVWVDLASHSAIVKWERYFSDKLFARLVVNYQKTPFDWLPKAWTCDYFIGSPKSSLELSAHHQVNVDDVRINDEISPSDLDISLHPGHLVTKQGVDNVPFKVAPDGKTLLTLRASEWRIIRAGTIWRIATAVLIAVAGVTIYLKRKRRSDL